MKFENSLKVKFFQKNCGLFHFKKPSHIISLKNLIIVIAVLILFVVKHNWKLSAIKDLKQHSIPEVKITFNLLEDSQRDISRDVCNLEYVNSQQIEQDHPCLIEIIRSQYLYPPADENVYYFLEGPNLEDPSAGQVESVLKYLNDQTEGFFFECGAGDGELLSNTLYMERFQNWTGILIEAGQLSFGKLLNRRRKSYSMPVCLSLEPFPTKVTFKEFMLLGSVQEVKTREMKNYTTNGMLAETQCFPFYSILLAIGRTHLDYLSLDVEGHELRILGTIPWHKVDIKVMTVEWNHVGIQPILDFLVPKNYLMFGFMNDIIRSGTDLYLAKEGKRSLRI